MKVVRSPAALAPEPRAVAVGSFDGVHRGHIAVVDAARGTGFTPTVITFDPHPRIALGNKVELLTTLDRRLEHLQAAGVEAVVVATFDAELQRLKPEEFAERYLHAIGVEAIVAGEDFRFGVRRSGDLALLERLGFRTVVVPELPGVSSTAIRTALGAGDVIGAAAMLRRPSELDGVVVAGDQRGGTLGYPTANLRLEPDLACPQYGIYAGSALGHRAAISIGTNPHYGGTERRIEPYLLDFGGDLYGKRLVVELWERLRDEAVFESEAALVEQIALDVDATKAARRPGPESLT